MAFCLANADATACARCGWQKSAKIAGWPRKNCPKPYSPEEVAQHKALCEEPCDFWTDHDHNGKAGCRLVQEFERERLTAYRWTHGHCARCAKNGGPKW